jgi:ATP-dependent DNA helicase RecQ
MAWLAEHLPNVSGSGIIYTLTVRDAIRVSEWLKSRGINVESYTGQTGDRRDELEQSLLDNKVKALVATTALGMGFDKPDLAFVIHYQTPGSVVAYYQQVGRAGRALKSAYGVLLSGKEDTDIIDYFIETAFPTREEAEQVLNALDEEVGGLSIPELMERLNISFSRIQKTIDLLSLESPAPIVKQGTKWILTTTNLSEDFWKRAHRLTELRRSERNQMQEYVSLSSGHMDFLIRALDGESDEENTSSLPSLPGTVNAQLVHEAIEFLRGSSLSIEPRKKWPSGGMPMFGLKGIIRPEYLAESGKVLCMWGDAGWGRLVQAGKYYDGRFSDELVKACAALMREWNPLPAPTWITCIPSTRHPHLVSDFAQRLSYKLGLPFRNAIVKTQTRPEQKTMANSTQQARNVDGSLTLIDRPLPAGPVLLIDDMVDSRWTFTVAAWLLRINGSGEVWPLALAITGNAQ